MFGARAPRPSEFIVNPHVNLAGFRRKFAGILKQVPKNLSHARAIREDVRFSRDDLERNPKLLSCSGTRAVSLHRVFEQWTDIHRLPLHLQLATDTPVTLT